MSKIKKPGNPPAAPDPKSPAGNRTADARFRKLIENSHEGIALVNKDYEFIYRSASAKRINGWNDENRAKVKMDDLVHPDYKALVRSVLEEVIAHPGIPKTVIFRALHFEGHYIWIQTTYTNFLDDVDINAIVCNFSDITERKQKEEKITESERFTKTVTDNLPALIAYFNSDADCLFANKPYMEWFDKQPHEILGVNKRNILDKEEFGLHEAHINEVLKGNPQRFERTIHKANGRTIDTDTQYLPDIEGGKVKGFFSLIYDVTAIKQAETEVRKKNEQIENILESITDGFVAIDGDMRYTYGNKRVEEIFGVPVSKILGKTVLEIFPGAVDTETYKSIKKALQEKIAVSNEDYYAPLNLWSENRIFPASDGVSMFIRNITKRKEEEQRLKLLESVITNTTDAVLITDAEPLDEPGPRIVYVNEAFSKMTGYSTDELIGKTPRILQGPKSDLAELKKLSACMHRRKSCELTIINYKKNGKEFWVNFTVSPVISDRGECTHFIAIERDISERKDLEEMVAKANLLARIGSWEVDVINETVYWSDITREIHEAEQGYHPGIEAATNFYKKGLNREIIVKTMENAIKNGTPGDVELQIVTAKGNTKWVRVIVEAEFADGYCKRVYGSFQDIDTRKKAEIASKEALEERNTILESIDDAFFAIDKNWVVTYWNNMAEKVLMTPRDQILNHNLWEIFSDSVGSESYKKYHEAVETNKAAHFEDYFEPLHKWYEISAYPSEKGLSVYFKDITDRKLSDTLLKELNANLHKQTKELAISNAELEQFAYVASHDLQEPLRMVTSFLTQLEKKYAPIIDDKGKQYINFAVDGAKRMRQIILDLLDFSRIGRTEDDLEDVNFTKLIAEIIALYRRLIEEENAIITVENMPVIKTYKTPVRQVFQNLIGNSLKYHWPGVTPEIHVACVETTKYFQFSVKDNGIGIASEYFDKIFIIFQRLHNKDEYSGTGMGLAIAKKIVESLGGKIWVESEEGKGSTFYFTLLRK